MYYYEVGIGAKRHWKSESFTYESNQDIQSRTIVRVPFGITKKIGVVLRKVVKPTYNCKEILDVFDFRLNEQTEAFVRWFSDYHAVEGSQAWQQLLPTFLTAKPAFTSVTGILADKPLSMTESQKKAYTSLLASSNASVFHGITGAGKTRVYNNLLLHTLKSGKNALLLYPEIILTPQLIEELRKTVPVLAFHSGLTDAERSKLWYTVANLQQPTVIIGPRSSLFLPYPNLGLIIVDEAHEPSYKQEADVRYHALSVAAGLAKNFNAKLILGSATPPITETNYITDKGGSLVCLHDKAIESNYKKHVEIIDARKKELFTRHPLLSDKLIAAIESALENHKQSLLFINRRGTAKLLFCTSETCEWEATCSKCDLPLTYHHDLGELICHTCGKKEPVLAQCKECGRPTEIKSLGSKAIVEEVERLFPTAQIGRYDSDTVSANSFNTNFLSIKSGKVDILIGTQQLVKGLDLPRLNVVGVLNADLSLHFPDYSSEERTFQLLTQVIGRVGRGHGEGRVFIQTHQPSNPLFHHAISENWHQFMRNELEQRKLHHLPPYKFYAKLVFREKSQSAANKKADRLKTGLLGRKIQIEGPMPAFYSKRAGFYFVQLQISSTSRARLRNAVQAMKDKPLIDLDPISLL